MMDRGDHQASPRKLFGDQIAHQLLPVGIKIGGGFIQ
jgi:hypothetical protein